MSGLNLDGPLLTAAREGRAAVVQSLLFVGADVEATDCDGNTPVLLAAKGNHVQAVTALVRWPGRTDVRDQAGNTPLHLPTARGDVDGHRGTRPVSCQHFVFSTLAKTC